MDTATATASLSPTLRLAGTDLDIFIPPDGMGSALHGDRVEVHFQRSTKGFKGEGRMEGRVIQVIERAQKTVVGQFHAGTRYNYVMPFDQRIPFEIVIPDVGAVREPPLQRNRQFGGESEGRRVERWHKVKGASRMHARQRARRPHHIPSQ